MSQDSEEEIEFRNSSWPEQSANLIQSNQSKQKAQNESVSTISNLPQDGPQKEPKKIEDNLRFHMNYKFYRKTEEKETQSKILYFIILITQKFYEFKKKKLQNFQQKSKPVKVKQESIDESQVQNKKKRKRKCYMIYTPDNITIVDEPTYGKYPSVIVKKPCYSPKKCTLVDYIRPSRRKNDYFDEQDLIYCIGIILDECLMGERYDGSKQYAVRLYVNPQIRDLLMDILGSEESKIRYLVDLETRMTRILATGAFVCNESSIKHKDQSISNYSKWLTEINQLSQSSFKLKQQGKDSSQQYRRGN